MTASALVKEVRESGAESCIITGGEPCVHDLNPLVDALDRAHVAAHLETSGAFPIRGSVTWTVLSPKRWKLPINETVMRADEFKFIIETPEDIQFYHNLLFPSGEDSLLREVWLHPEWSKRQDPTVLKAISDAVKSKENKSRRFRAGWQLHKMYQCDLLDDRSKDPVPLGGDEKRGY
ncbi:MAG: hypothetical protein Unbinned3891contig1000_21 [Prokaryotic dsDNA virus sp.]|nr:MAG: hypothetical protein Unbinned3891contig1000_21 [Prokaryotic dsDNA virus sp.]